MLETNDKHAHKKASPIQLDIDCTLEEAVSYMILRAHNMYNGNLRQAARHIGISRQTLTNKLKARGWFYRNT